jgi:two-component system response regulator FixJ
MRPPSPRRFSSSQAEATFPQQWPPSRWVRSTFIEKPFDAETVVDRVGDALARRAKQSPDDLVDKKFPGHETLTPREREVLAQITAGASNKEAGRTLGISPRTIEVHRARIMEKLGARNAADLVRIVLAGN